MQALKHTDESRETHNALQSGDWRLLAERASKEMDPDKLMSLVLELNRVLEESQRKRPTSSENSHENGIQCRGSAGSGRKLTST
jgi:hypothetical protein